MWNVFSIFDVKYSIKELLHKPSEIQYNWNSTRKTKKKIFLDFILQDVTPWNHKNVRHCYFGRYYGVLGTKVEFNVFLWFCGFSKSFSLYLLVKIYFLVKNSFNFKLGFFTYFEYISGGIIRKNILRSDCHSARWHWCKKYQKTFHKLHIKFFLNA